MLIQGDLVRVKNEIYHEDKWLYIDDYENFGEGASIFGVIQCAYTSILNDEKMIEVLIGNEVIKMPACFVEIVPQ